MAPGEFDVNYFKIKIGHLENLLSLILFFFFAPWPLLKPPANWRWLWSLTILCFISITQLSKIICENTFSTELRTTKSVLINAKNTMYFLVRRVRGGVRGTCSPNPIDLKRSTNWRGLVLTNSKTTKSGLRAPCWTKWSTTDTFLRFLLAFTFSVVLRIVYLLTSKKKDHLSMLLKVHFSFLERIELSCWMLLRDSYQLHNCAVCKCDIQWQCDCRSSSRLLKNSTGLRKWSKLERTLCLFRVRKIWFLGFVSLGKKRFVF